MWVGVGSLLDLQRMEEDDHQVQMIEDGLQQEEDDLQVLGEGDGLLVLMVEDSLLVQREVLMGDLLDQVDVLQVQEDVLLADS